MLFRIIKFILLLGFFSEKKIKKKKKYKDEDYEEIIYEEDHEYDDPVTNIVWFNRPYRKPGDVHIGVVRVGEPPLSVMHIKEDPKYPFFLFVDTLIFKRTRVTADLAKKLMLTYEQKLDKFERKTWYLRQFLNSHQTPIIPQFLERIESILKASYQKFMLTGDIWIDKKKISNIDVILFFLKLPFEDIFEDILIKHSLQFYKCLFLVNSKCPAIILKMWYSCLLAPKHDVFYSISDFLIFLLNPHVLSYWYTKSDSVLQSQVYWTVYYLYEILLHEDPYITFDFVELLSFEQKNVLETLSIFSSSSFNTTIDEDSYALFKRLQTANFVLKDVLNQQARLFNKEDLLIRKKLQEASHSLFNKDNRYYYLYYFGDDVSFFYSKHPSAVVFNQMLQKINISQNFIDIKHNLLKIEKKFIYMAFRLGAIKFRIEPHHSLNRFSYWFKYVYGYELNLLNSWFWDRYCASFELNDIEFNDIIRQNFLGIILTTEFETVEEWGPFSVFKNKLPKKLFL